MGTSREKEIATSWLGTVADIGKSTSSANIARRTFDILKLTRDEAAVEVLLHWVTHADDTSYESLGVPSLLNEVKFYGLDGAIREAMYPLLEKKLKENAACGGHPRERSACLRLSFQAEALKEILGSIPQFKMSGSATDPLADVRVKLGGLIEALEGGE